TLLLLGGRAMKFRKSARARRAPSHRTPIEPLERRQLLTVAPNGYLICFTAAIDLLGDNTTERGGIYVMRPDGSNMRQITSFGTDHFNYSGDGLNLPDDHASFSPDGKKIIFTSSRDHPTGLLDLNSPDQYELYTMNANGSDVRRLTNNSVLDTE